MNPDHPLDREKVNSINLHEEKGLITIVEYLRFYGKDVNSKAIKIEVQNHVIVDINAS